MSNYSATKVLPAGRKVWILTFRHPFRKDPRGKAGLKVRRSLGTTDEAEAARLVEQMNVLLSDNGLHSILKRQEAERRFDPIVISAFYDALDGSVGDLSSIRDSTIPFPPVGVPRVLLAGVTGSGKTSLLRQLIGSDPKVDRFPSTSTARTTTCDIEIIVAPNSPSFNAVVTFRSQWETTATVAECVSNSCLAVIQGLPEQKIADRLLHHPDQIFRLNYVLGSYGSTRPVDADDWGYEGEHDSSTQDAASDDASVSAEQRAELQSALKDFVGRTRILAEAARAKAEQDLRDLNIRFDALSSTNKEFAEEYFEEVLENLPEFDGLVDDILEQILSRFDHLPQGERGNRPGGWPESWACESDARDREDFIRRVRWFSSNHAQAFGRLVTPLVQGIRVRGPFVPRFTKENFDIVLIDGQGFGHTPESTASVSTHVTKRYADVDAILLVDNATQSMLPASLSILRSALSSGHQRKLAIAFTHVDQVLGPNLPDFTSKRLHVVNSAVGGLRSLHEVLGASLVEALEKQLDDRCFLLGWLDKPMTERSKGPARELERLLAFCQDSILPEAPTQAVPLYDPAGLLFAAQSADAQFQELWKARLGYVILTNVQRKPWQTVKALNRRIALGFDNREYSDLRPAAELVACLSESIGRFLDKPIRWHGPSDADQRQTAIDNVRRRVFADLHGFVENRLLSSPLPDWLRAYDFSGRFSTFSRAETIKEIVEEAAPIPSEAMSREVSTFLNELRALVHAAIKEGGGRLHVPDAAPAAVAH